MAVRTLDDLLTSFRGFGLDENSAEFISMLEDMTDSYTGSEAIEQAKSRILELEQELSDANKRYVDRFFGGSVDTPPENHDEKEEDEKEEKEEYETFDSDEEMAKDMMEE